MTTYLSAAIMEQSACSFIGFSQPKPASQQYFSLKKTSTNQPKPASAPTSEQAQKCEMQFSSLDHAAAKYEGVRYVRKRTQANVVKPTPWYLLPVSAGRIPLSRPMAPPAVGHSAVPGRTPNKHACRPLQARTYST